ncbi:MAG TPA: sigma-70 family RNA polymerase sigma factor, partial [Blastocatellia bacterium]|nr:sigma-70 family RNA polymerase sigma factor [Blastocatellia bacterium]
MNKYDDLTARARRGDEDAFRQIFERYGRPIISFIYDMVGQRELAEELMQETFVRAYKNLGGLREETKLSTWLFGIAKNVARESLRSRQKDYNKVD